MGIPFNTRFAQVMVKADYDMKRIVDGKDSLSIEGFESLTGMKLNQIREDIINNRPSRVSIGGMNRFWFYPGENIYQEDEDIFMIERCPVTLLTEENYLSSSGDYVSSGNVDQHAQQFCENFTECYDQVSELRPIYRDLENLFRTVALAKIIKFKSSHTNAGLDLSYFLEHFPVKKSEVKPQLPGRSAVKEFHHKQEFEDGYQITRLWLPSCGGVSIKIPVGQIHFKKNVPKFLRKLKYRIFESRPSLTSDSWSVNYESIASISRSRNIIKNNKNFSYLAVEKSKDGYRVSGSWEDYLYEGQSIHEMADAVNCLMGKELKNALYFQPLNFQAKEIEGFESTLQIYQQRAGKNIIVKPLSCSPELIDIVTSSKLGLIEIPTIRIEQDLNRNTHKATVKFSVKLEQKIIRFSTEIVAKSRQIIDKFLKRLMNKGADSGSLLDDAIRIRKELKKEYDLEDKEIDAKIIDEIGFIEIVIFLDLNKKQINESTG